MRLIRYSIVCLLFLSQNIFAVTEIQGVRVWPSPDNVRVVFDLSSSVRYKVTTLDAPFRVVIDFLDTNMLSSVSNVALGQSLIRKIRSGVHPGNKLRVVLDLSTRVSADVFALAPAGKYGHRLVLDLQYKATPSKPPATLAPQKLNAKPNSSDFIVAIDAGHGGDDPGAIGPHGTREKDVALGVARYLRDQINKQPRMRAVLIRDGDYYIGLRERMRRARKNHAHLFLSIHADAFTNKNADGASVFVLSNKRASSEAARWLAESENRADLVGGVSLDDKSDVLASVLLDLSKTASAKASMSAAKDILHSLGNTTKLHKGEVESAGFMVLRAPDMPAILIETGFISNPKTERKLRDKKYQYKLATAIMNGVKNYQRRQTH